MSRRVIGGLLAVFAVILIFGYSSTIPLGDDDPRPVDESAGTGGDGSLEEVGESIYEQQCSGCHTIDGSEGVGPSLAGLYGSDVSMEDGSTVEVDEDHLVESITDPNAQTREGFPSVMPSFSNLSDDEIAGLVAFIQSLE
ncbi:MAG: cytochrome c [Thermomicrobiaceae bacterium]